MKGSDGRYVYGNAAWGAQFGKPAEALLGRTDFDLWPEETALNFQESDRKALMSRTPIELVQSGVSHNGVVQWWTTLKFLIEQPAGAPLIGEHNQEIFCGELGVSQAELAALAESGVI